MVDKTKDKNEEGKKPESDDPVELAKKELDELQSLIPDIQVKVIVQLFMLQNTVITWGICMWTPQHSSPIVEVYLTYYFIYILVKNLTG